MFTSLVRKLVRAPSSLLCFGTSTANIHTIVKSINDNLTQDKHQNHYLLRRHVIDWLLFRRDTHESKHSNLSSATSRICQKLEKVYVDTIAGSRVFGPDNQLCYSRTFFKQNRYTESSFKMWEFVKQTTNLNSGADKADWPVCVNYSSSFTSNVESSFPPNATNIIPIRKDFLFRQNCFERKLKSQTEMLATNLRTVQWPSINSSTCRSINTDRCLKKVLSANVQ